MPKAQDWIDDLVADLDRVEGTPVGGAPSFVGQTTTIAVYPTTAGAWYGVVPQLVGGTESEGSAASYSADPSKVVLAYNLGNSIPSAGTRVVVHNAGGRWVFRHGT